MAFTFNPGQMDQRVDVLGLQAEGTVYSWATARTIYAGAEEQPHKNIFSEVGIGVQSVKFTIRKQDVTLSNAFSWHGDHYFLTRIEEFRRLYYEVTAAKIEPKTCTVKRLPSPELDSGSNRPKKLKLEVVMTFPGYLTEKYMGFMQQTPQAQAVKTFVLVTPKQIALKVADLIVIESSTYQVQVPHELDEYKNEYEIYARTDV